MLIRQGLDADLESVVSVQKAAFGSDEEATLAKHLIADPTAGPVVSMLAFYGDKAVGNALFTSARLEPEADLRLSILAPMAVVPEFQNQGIGGKLIEAGLRVLTDRGTNLVFVLGYPAYYGRFGFSPAGRLGFDAPYPIAEQHADAWMVRELGSRGIARMRGRVVCADALNRLEYWRE